MGLLNFIWDSWRVMTWRMAGFTVLAGFVLMIVYVTTHQGFFIFLHDIAYKPGTFLEMLASNLGLMQLFVFVFLLCILVARRTVAQGARRVVAYSAAIAVAALLCAALDFGFKMLTGFYEQGEVQWWWRPVDALWILVTFVMLGAPCTFAYVDYQRAQESAARLHAAGLARTRAARGVLQTRLQALQARVEPQFLFDTLARVKQLYDRDFGKGEATLDALIAYLRMAMPQMRRPGSTLARECELARTYVEIVAARGDARLRIAIDDGDNSVNEPFPAMVLLPLVDHALTASRATPLHDNAIDIRAVVVGARLVVTVGHSGGAFSSGDSPAITRVRDQLHALFDGDATLDVHARDAGGSETTLEVPHEQP